MVFWAADLSAVYEPPHLALALNILFMLPVALLVAYGVGRSFLLHGNRRLLWLGCGMLFWSSAGLLGGALLSQGTNVSVTVYTLLIWLAAVCHWVSVLFIPWQQKAVRWPELWLTGAYVGVLAVAVVVVLATLAESVPAFFIPGTGGTTVRQIVLGSAIVLFVLTAVALKGDRRETSALFEYGYSVGLLLLAVGLFGLLITPLVGSALSWIGRFAQYLGSAYLVVAVVVGMRETCEWSHPLDTALGEARPRFDSVICDITACMRVEATLRESEQFKQSVLDAMIAHIAVIDPEGCIIAINEPWRRFAVENNGGADQPAPNTGIGVNYLDICRATHGECIEDALEALDGIQAVLEGRAASFSHEYACHAPGKQRWFSMVVTSLSGRRGKAVISHTDITASRELMEKLRNERDRFTRIAATVPGAICSFRLGRDGSACFPYASPTIQDLYGLRPEALAESAAPLWAIIHPDDLGPIEAGITASAQAMTPWRNEFRVLHPIKGQIWVEGHSMPGPEPDGSILWHGYVQDITEHKQAERQLFEAHERLHALMQALPVGVSFSDDTTCQHVMGNSMLLAQFEMTPQDNISASAPEVAAAGRRVRYFHHGQELSDRELPLQRAVAENRVISSMELEVWLPSGRCWFAEVIGAPLRDAKNQIIGGLAVIMDITERKRLEEDLRRLATTDPLTGAFNRRHLLQVMETEISRAQRHARPLSLIMFDLDHFKRINDHFGHHQGDAVLKGVAATARERLRHSDIFVRWGGEEFMILAPETAMPQALALAETLRAGFRRLSNAGIGAITASFGVTQYRPGETVDQWLKRVDDLVYQVKRQGRDHISHGPSESPVG